MARILHTADWHVGKALGKISRRDDHVAVLAEIVEQAVEHQPDLIVHSGDVFDIQLPGQDSQQIAFQALAAMSEVAPVVVIAGNHDPVTAFMGLAKLLGDNPRVLLLAKPENPAVRPLPVYELANGERIRVAAVPWIAPNRLVDFFAEGQQIASYQEGVKLINAAYANALTEGYDAAHDVLLYVAHEHVTGAVMSGSERSLQVGDAFQSDATTIPQVAYAALGHIHKPQQIAGGPGFYAGSPMQLDFGEAGEEKSSVLITAEPGRPAVIERLPLTTARPLVKFTGTLEQIAEPFAIPDRAILRALIEVDDIGDDLADQLQALLPDVTLESAEPLLPGADRALEFGDADGEAEPTVEELLGRHLETAGTKNWAVKPERVIAVFSRLWEQATNPDADPTGTPDEVRALLRTEPPVAPNGTHLRVVPETPLEAVTQAGAEVTDGEVTDDGDDDTQTAIAI